ncbi:alpha/beta fold hydrolase [Rhodococcus sp. UNC23MFCrub1.1]|uniref:alpha/beta fold hydrolase n=1 Tax=Rhodococcus sp. UNC23MFCrub1.1 TaxID=1449068 RepID=UPI0005614A89|nr:alpha/beta hydrolase [Rhodococcus sp. UNC23MFCrub1.1]
MTLHTAVLPGERRRATVFLHGLGSAGVAAFGTVAAGLDDRLRLLPDLLGFADSADVATDGYTLDDHALAVARMLDQHELVGLDVVGHSMGGSIAIVLSRARPDLVRRLTVLEPNLLPFDGEASVEIAGQSEEDFATQGVTSLIARADAAWAETLRLADPVALHRSAVGLCVGPPDTTVLDILLVSHVPRTLLYGSRTGEPTHTGRLRQAGVEVVEIPNAGHVMMADDPAAVIQVLR